MSATAYPLAWPLGRPRTDSHRRESSKFKAKGKTIAKLRDDLLRELGRLGARSIVLSTNLRLRKDDLPYSDQRQPDDPGVAVYFADRRGRSMCFSCDRWKRVEDNLHAVALTIEAIRGIERWGSGDAVDAAFTGFAQLPPPASVGDEFSGNVTVAVEWLSRMTGIGEMSIADSKSSFDEAYRRAAKRLHPDAGGTEAGFKKLQAAAALIGNLHGSER